MSKLIGKVAGWIANELITKRLAQSEAFANAAHKIHSHVKTLPDITAKFKDTPPTPIDPYRIASYQTPKQPQNDFVKTFMDTLQKESDKQQKVLRKHWENLSNNKK